MILISADLHAHESKTQEYRWEVYPWLRKQCKRYDVSDVFLLGDLTDAKDCHSSVLINRLVRELAELGEISRVHILMGNHDYKHEGSPFLSFLAYLTDHRVHWYQRPQVVDAGPVSILMLPHSFNPQEEWQRGDWFAAAQTVDFVFTHQTYTGCIMENGREATGGLPTNIFRQAKVVSGDIHVPQMVGANITYVGAPHPVKWGDTFQPRVLKIEDGKLGSIPVAGLRKHVLTIHHRDELDKIGFEKGDHLKLTVKLDRADFGDWDEIRRDCHATLARLGVEVFACRLEAANPIMEAAVTVKTDELPTQVLAQYGKDKGLDGLTIEAGEAILAEISGL